MTCAALPTTRATRRARPRLCSAVELLEPILAYDLGGVEPTFHPVGGMANVVREDVPVPGLSLSDALANAASTQGRAFRVPAILANEGGS